MVCWANFLIWLWKAKLTEAQIFRERELAIWKERFPIQLESSLVQTESSLFQSEGSPVQLKSSLVLARALHFHHRALYWIRELSELQNFLFNYIVSLYFN